MRNNIHRLLPAFLLMWTLPGVTAWAGEPFPPSDEAGQKRASWQVAIDATHWAPVVDEVNADQRPQQVLWLDGPADDSMRRGQKPYRAEIRDGNVAFEVEGRLPYPRTMIWSADVRKQASCGPCSHFCLRYRAKGIERSHQPVGVLSVTGQMPGDKPASVALLTVAQIFNDDRWHQVVGKTSTRFSPDTLQVRVTTSGTLGRFEIGQLSFHESLPEIQSQLLTPTRSKSVGKARLECLDLGSQYNYDCDSSFRRMMDAHAMVVDGGNRFGDRANSEQVIAGGIPFQIHGGKHNLIRPAEDPALNAEKVDFLGTKTTRHYWKPRGRDDRIEVPVGRRASEVFIVMAAELPPSESCYARPSWPRPVDDIETLAVELVYADGERDFAFPYSLADGGFRVRRALGAYVVPAASERTLQSVILHNRLPGRTFSLAAVTVNTSATRVFPKALVSDPPVRVPLASSPPRRDASVVREGDLIRFSNTWYDLVVDCSQGFSVRSVSHHASNVQTVLHPSSGVEVELGNTILTGRAFRTESVDIDGRSAIVRLRSSHPTIPLRLLLRLRIDDSPQLTMNLTVESTGTSPLAAAVRFPVLRDITIGRCDDTWMFFPQYRNVISNRHGTYYVPNDCRFPVQVLDIYNPRAGLGLGVITHNRDHRSLDYSMGKSSRGVSAYVQAPGELYPLEPGRSVTLTESVLLFHQGDWHEAVQAYRDWLTTLPASAPTHTRDWFRRLSLLRCHQTKKFYSWAVPIYEPKTRSYLVDAFVRADTDYLGVTPEVFHFFGWTDLENSWHGHPNGDFRVDAYTGGPEALKSAIRQLLEKHAIRTSLYTLSDRCLKNSHFGQQHGQQLAIRNRDGSRQQDEFNWFLCGCSQEWRDHYVEALCRTQRETNVKILYVDVFPFSRGSACYAPDHGHQVPSHVDQGTYALIRQLRERLPEDVAIWSEYPLPDAAQQYIDGNIHYYCLDWHEHFGKTYDQTDEAQPFAATPQNVYRYIFPRLKQFVFLCGISPWSGDSKFPFFNGEALYDCSWSLYAGQNLDRIKKSLKIQREYADCFSTLRPIPEVATLQREVHANYFPGHERVAWTLFNARYTTVRGPILAVKHRPGATYRDVWNGVPLEPKIVDGQAVLELRLYPQQLGCVVQNWQKG